MGDPPHHPTGKTILFLREMAGPICKWVLAITLSAITTTTDDESEVMFY
jgi:hypothetical protein